MSLKYPILLISSLNLRLESDPKIKFNLSISVLENFSENLDKYRQTWFKIWEKISYNVYNLSSRGNDL